MEKKIQWKQRACDENKKNNFSASSGGYKAHYSMGVNQKLAEFFFFFRN